MNDKKTVRLTASGLRQLMERTVGTTVRGELERRALVEKEKQVPTKSAPADDGAVDDMFGDEESSPEQEEKPEPNQAAPVDGAGEDEEVTLETIVEKLNTIRSGRSFKDDDVASEMGTWFEGLDENERLALSTFLKGISQIVTGGLDGESAVEPEDAPDPGVKITNKNGDDQSSQSSVKKIPPQSSKKSFSGRDVVKRKSGEDSSSPVPIVAKRK